MAGGRHWWFLPSKSCSVTHAADGEPNTTPGLVFVGLMAGELGLGFASSGLGLDVQGEGRAEVEGRFLVGVLATWLLLHRIEWCILFSNHALAKRDLFY